MKMDCSKSTLEVSIISTNDAECNNSGSILASSSGGSGDVKFSLDGSNFQSSTTFNVSSGNYTITAKDDNCIATTNVTVNAGADAIVIGPIESTDSGCGTSNGSITVSASGGVSALMYRLNSGSFQASSSFTGVSAGTHTITVADGTCTSQMAKKVLSGTVSQMK